MKNRMRANKKPLPRDYNKAKLFVHTLGLKSWREWHEYADSRKRPTDIPKYPTYWYKNKGWISINDWLGIAPRIKMRPYNEARLFVHSLKLDGYKGWLIYRKSGKKPKDIPYNPRSTYKEFVSYGDWTGCPKRSAPREFSLAIAFVHTLGLKSWREWEEFVSSKQRPIDIPKYPERSYKNKGWISLKDWLGTTKRLGRKTKI